MGVDTTLRVIRGKNARTRAFASLGRALERMLAGPPKPLLHQGGLSDKSQLELDTTQYAALFQLYHTTESLQRRFALSDMHVRFTFTQGNDGSWEFYLFDDEYAADNRFYHAGRFQIPHREKEIRHMFTKPYLNWRYPGMLEFFEGLFVDPCLQQVQHPAMLWIAPVVNAEPLGKNVRLTMDPHRVDVYYQRQRLLGDSQ